MGFTVHGMLHLDGSSWQKAAEVCFAAGRRRGERDPLILFFWMLGRKPKKKAAALKAGILWAWTPEVAGTLLFGDTQPSGCTLHVGTRLF